MAEGVPAPPPVEIPWSRRVGLTVQREVGRGLGIVWIPLIPALLEHVMGYEVEGMEAARREYQRIRADTGRPLMICANHLTMIDSAIIAWALGSPGWYLLHYSSLPWNVPERRNFATTFFDRVTSYVMKCLPITRGGPRTEIAQVLAEFSYLLSRGEVGLVFPEGGRSRSGRVDLESAASGVGRIVQSLPGCQVLCVYLRGRSQATFSNLPTRGERFTLELELMEPKSEHRGLRGSRDVARKIVARLAALEEKALDGR